MAKSTPIIFPVPKSDLTRDQFLELIDVWHPRWGTARERFYRAFEVLPNGCWEWRKSRTKDGYPQIRVRGIGGMYAHRFSYLLYVGELPPSMNALHKCDNPGCVCPDHLFAGTLMDNNQDCLAKGRYARGERSGNAKLTDEQAIAIRTRIHAGERPTDLGREFGVDLETIRHIRRGTTFSHLPVFPYSRLNTRLTEEQVSEIRRLVASGERHRVVAERFGVSQSHVTRIVNLQKRKQVA